MIFVRKKTINLEDIDVMAGRLDLYLVCQLLAHFVLVQELLLYHLHGADEVAFFFPKIVIQEKLSKNQ